MWGFHLTLMISKPISFFLKTFTVEVNFLSFSNMHAVTAVYIILLFATCSLWVSAVLPNLSLHISCIIVASSMEYCLQYHEQCDKVFDVPSVPSHLLSFLSLSLRCTCSLRDCCPTFLSPTSYKILAPRRILLFSLDYSYFSITLVAQLIRWLPLISSPSGVTKRRGCQSSTLAT